MAIRSERDPISGALKGKWFSGRDLEVLFEKIERQRFEGPPSDATIDLMRPATESHRSARRAHRMTKPFAKERLL